MEPYIHFDDVDRYGPQKKAFTFELSAAELDRPEIEAAGEVRVDVEVNSGDLHEEYMVSGQVEFSADLVCSRCLDPFPVATASPFHLRYRPRPAGPTEELEVEITGEDLDVEYYSDRMVALRDLAIEQIHLSVPMKPLCEESCVGLCAHCGANLNKGECACAGEEPDDRWAALRDFREQLVKKKQS